MEDVDIKAVAKKWQKEWDDKKVFRADADSKKKKCYVLEMFPYPSAAGLHMGHALNYTIGDIYARFKRMQGFNVLYPMGYDAFGLPAENAAIKAGEHPWDYTLKSMANFELQQRALGLSYDWDRKVVTCSPEYYKWNQYFFIKLFEKGLVYRKKSAVNWCPQCNTVLANEQVHSGKCWRHEETEVEMKQLEQWFIKTTAYTEELLDDIKKLDWPQRIKIMQENWIGKSYGTEIMFEINKQIWPIFTTRPDTIFGVTFMVVAAQHPRLSELVTKEQRADVDVFLKKLKSVSEKELEEMEKEGVFTGSYAINPITKEKIPVYAGNFVVADYGAGMVMAVPAHDQRDFEFAEKYDIPIKQVVAPVFITDTSVDAIRPDKPTIERKSVFGIVKHWKEDKYFCLDWKKYNWKTFVLGGIEDGESAEKAIIREVKEETGYQEIKSVREISFEVYSKFFATHKDVNRISYQRTFLVELGSDKHIKPEEKHTKNHDGVWVDKKDVASFLTIKNQMFVWNSYINGMRAFTDEGMLINSREFNGMQSEKAIEAITEHLEKKGLGKKTFNYKFRDWLVSRQRYWGTPIPMVYCEKCGVLPVPEKELPVLLPKDVKFGQGNPLASSKEFTTTKCPKCQGAARREIDTMDTFFDSSWYYLRYCDNKNNEKPFDSIKANYWMPVDQYIGGAEHACMHLIYARFFTKALRDMGMLKVDEPFPKLFNQGMLHGSDGNKMSKSLGNVVNPIEMIDNYGSDALRFNLMSLASPDSDSVWNDKGMESSYKFITKMYNWMMNAKQGSSSAKAKNKLHSTIKEVTEDIQSFKYNIALIKIRECFDYLEKEEISREDLEMFIKMMHPFCPFMTEQAWHSLGNKSFVSLESWPKADENLIDSGLDASDVLIQSMISDVYAVKKLAGVENIKKITLIVSAEWKYELFKKLKEELKKSFNAGEVIKTIMATDLKKYGQEITKIIPSIIKDPSKLPDVVLDQEKEKQSLLDAKEKLAKEFGESIELEVVLAEKSNEAKAKNAMPGRPAIIIS